MPASDAETQLREVEQQASELYGTPLPELTGVIHVLSAVRARDDRWHVIKINEQAPKSPTDFFVLNFWRAHCDAILTSAQVVRAEPQLSQELQGPLARGLSAYRAQVLGKPFLPWCALLTRGGDIPLDHRMFGDRIAVVVLTLPETVPQLSAALDQRAKVVGVEALDTRRAVEYIQGRGARTVLIEAGPSLARQLYSAPSLVDHVLVSRYEGEIDPAAIGGELPDDAILFAGLTRKSEHTHGTWRFERWERG